ncbi:hypothetical protein BD311DRAFT_744128 [Dichomitus squalens]|uniref:Uncharacterized protein n=1 Tax=Dichomitus squalens TaxID=114155 RepID=A0A4V2K269_9APHY|nr:hypothetical protein BD311DRAFT_744128 [Dichomitus squalens]
MINFFKMFPKLVQEGVLKPLPANIREGGLSAIPDGLPGGVRSGNSHSAESLNHKLNMHLDHLVLRSLNPKA